MYDIVIKNGLCLMDGEFIECNVGINGKRIVYIGRDDVVGDVVIDAHRFFVLPGFFNAHTHAAMSMLRSYAEGLPLKEWLEEIWKVESQLDERDVYWGTMLACLEMLRSGTTCFADMYIHMDSVAEAVGEFGLRAVLGYGMADRGDKERAEEELSTALTFASKWNDSFEGRIKCMLTPHAPYTCSPDFLEKVAEVSRKMGLVKHIHVAETLWEVREIKKRYGRRPLQLLDEIGFLDEKTVLAHAVWLTDSEIRTVAEKRASVAHCPASNMKLSSGIARIAEMLDAGINVCLGTDGAASNNLLNVFAEMRIAALLQSLRGKMIDAMKIIEMASTNGYAAYGLNSGAIQPGKLADIVIVRKSANHYPLYDFASSIVFGSLGCEVETVIVDGEIVMEDEVILTVDEERIISNVERRASRFDMKQL